MKHRSIFWRKLIIRILVGILIGLLSFEGFLRLFDPWAARPMVDDITIFSTMYKADPLRGYIMIPGSYQFSRWQATILPDGTRLIPDTNNMARCTIAVLGDSVAFGYGLSDQDTWANLLAEDFPDVHILNAGVSGYNIDNVAASLKTYPANGYLYFLIGNDAQPAFDWRMQPPHITSMIAVYLWWLQVFANGGQPNQPDDYSHFRLVFTDLVHRPDLITVSYPNALTTYAQTIGGVEVIQVWRHYISRVDPHPNADGAKEIAAQIKPLIAKLITKVCGEN